MSEITTQVVEELLSSDITFYRLENFVRKYGVANAYKVDFGESYKSVIEKAWEVVNKKFLNLHCEQESLTTNDILAAMEFDLVILPYTGVSFDKRKEFYVWCFEYIRKTQ